MRVGKVMNTIGRFAHRNDTHKAWVSGSKTKVSRPLNWGEEGVTWAPWGGQKEKRKNTVLSCKTEEGGKGGQSRKSSFVKEVVPKIPTKGEKSGGGTS